MTIFAPFATAWCKRYSPRIIVASGGLLFALSSILASFSQQLWQFQLTQGLLLGIATCLAYMTAVTVAPTWYSSRRGVAMGIILSGTGIGGLVWAPAIHAMNNHIGFRNALRLSGSLSGGLIMGGSIVLDWDPTTKARLDAEQLRQAKAKLWQVPLIDWRTAKTHKFALQLLGSSLQSAAYYTPIFFFSTYARTLGFSSTAGANFIAINNACNAIGKIVIGLIADRYGRLNTLFATTAISAIACFAFWLPSSLSENNETSRGLFIAYSILYGIFASAFVSLFPTSLVELFGPAHFAGVNGALYMARGLATLVGTPTAGLLIRSSGDGQMPDSYWRTTLMVGCLLGGASLAVLWVTVDAKRAIGRM
jgi:MFS family permease